MLGKLENLNVLQNIEWCLLSSAKKHPEICDRDLLNIIRLIIQRYKQGNEVREPVFDNYVHQEIYERLLSVSEWRLGKFGSHFDEEHLTVEDLLECLRKTEVSINFFAKIKGNRGYIEFASHRVLGSSV